MIYRIRANELDAKWHYVEADSQIEALQFAIAWFDAIDQTLYIPEMPLLIEWLSDEIIRK